MGWDFWLSSGLCQSSAIKRDRLRSEAPISVALPVMQGVQAILVDSIPKSHSDGNWHRRLTSSWRRRRSEGDFKLESKLETCENCESSRCSLTKKDRYTPWKFNIAPENKPSQKKISLPTIIFLGSMSMLNFGGGTMFEYTGSYAWMGVPSWERSHIPFWSHFWVGDFPFLRVGYGRVDSRDSVSKCLKKAFMSDIRSFLGDFQ